MTDQALSFEDVRKMRRGTRNYDIYTFPYTEDVYVWIRVLTQDEMVLASNNGRQKAKKIFADISGWEDTAYTIKEILYMATVKATADIEFPEEKFFSSAEEVWELSLDEMVMLRTHYEEIQWKYTPFYKAKTSEDFDKLISELKKKPQIGMSLSIDTLRLLVAYLTPSIVKLQNDNDSTYMSANQSQMTEKKNHMKKPETRGIKVIESSTE